MKKVSLNEIVNKNIPVNTYEEDNEKEVPKERRFQIALYVSEEEKKILQQKAKKLGMKISQFIRFKILHENI